jgi:hypothetical protein
VVGILWFHGIRSTTIDIRSCLEACNRDERASSSVARSIDPDPCHDIPSHLEFAGAEAGFIASSAAIKRSRMRRTKRDGRCSRSQGAWAR